MAHEEKIVGSLCALLFAGLMGAGVALLCLSRARLDGSASGYIADYIVIKAACTYKYTFTVGGSLSGDLETISMNSTTIASDSTIRVQQGAGADSTAKNYTCVWSATGLGCMSSRTTTRVFYNTKNPYENDASLAIFSRTWRASDAWFLSMIILGALLSIVFIIMTVGCIRSKYDRLYF